MKVFVALLALVALCNAKAFRSRKSYEDVKGFIENELDDIIKTAEAIASASELFDENLEPKPVLADAIDAFEKEVDPEMLKDLPPLDDKKKMHFLDKCIEEGEKADFTGMDDRAKLTAVARGVAECALAGFSIMKSVLDMPDEQKALEKFEAVALELGHLARWVIGFAEKVEDGDVDAALDFKGDEDKRKFEMMSKEEIMAAIADSSPEEIRKGAKELENMLNDAIKTVWKVIKLNGVLDENFQPRPEAVDAAKELGLDAMHEMDVLKDLPDLVEDKDQLFLAACEKEAKKIDYDSFSNRRDMLNAVFQQVLLCSVTGLEVMKDLANLDDMDNSELNVEGLTIRVEIIEQAAIELGHLAKWTIGFVERAFSAGPDVSANELVGLSDRGMKRPGKGKKPKTTGRPDDDKKPKPTGRPGKNDEDDDDDDDDDMPKPTGFPKRKGGDKRPKMTGRPGGDKRPKPTGRPGKDDEDDDDDDDDMPKPTGFPKRKGGDKRPKMTGRPGGDKRPKPTGRPGKDDKPKPTGRPGKFDDLKDELEELKDALAKFDKRKGN